MSSIFMIGKKGQYQQPSYGGVHPVLIVGIVIFIIPFMLPIIHVNIPNWAESGLRALGILTILIGGALSIFKSSN